MLNFGLFVVGGTLWVGRTKAPPASLEARKVRAIVDFECLI
jgi:hypothetical protein